MIKPDIVLSKPWKDKVLLKYYFGRPGWTNGRQQFNRLIEKFIKHGVNILEIGAGPTNKTTAFLATFGKVTGLDISSKVKSNKYCRETIVYDGIHIPCEANYFDVAVSDYVFEHVEHPAKLCYEIHRVLRPGGFYIFRTPNLWHYVSIAGRLSPYFIHKSVASRLRDMSSNPQDTYPTFYRMNTKRTCYRILRQAAFNVDVIKIIETEPSYGMASPFLFYPLMVWERLLNSSSSFEMFRANILCAASADKK